MNPFTHFFASWCFANTGDFEQRDRMLITLAGVAPDIDGLGGIVYVLTKDSGAPSMLFHDYHHVLCHNLLACLFFTAVVAILFAKRKKMAALFIFLSYHLHMFCDILGSRGPDGYQWPIPYLLPFSDKLQLTWSGQWQLSAWPNVALTVALMIASFILAWKKGFSFLEMISTKADEVFVQSLYRRFPIEEEK